MMEEEEEFEDSNNYYSERNSHYEDEIAQKIYSYYESEKEALRIAHSIRQHKMCVER